MSKSLKFSKWQGLGNDFILIEEMAKETSLDPADIVFLCDRRFGIGADGIMMPRPAADAEHDFSWFFANSDGTLPEMCGNGIRAFALHLKDAGLLDSSATSVSIETLAGTKVAEYLGDDLVRVDMGLADAKPNAELVSLESANAELIDVPLELHPNPFIAGDELKISFVSMGNPHAVIFTEELGLHLNDELVQGLGPIIEAHPAFPQKTNVEFIERINNSELKMRVFERGVGETLACGTGACAAAYAAYKKGLVGTLVKVHLLGGILEIEIKEDDRIFMTGPAKKVFSGEVVF